MSTLEKVMQMKQQGIPDWQIVQLLKQQGIYPQEIEEALSQSKIKSAVATGQQFQVANQDLTYTQEYPPAEKMQPTIMSKPQGNNIHENEEFPDYTTKEIPTSYKGVTMPYSEKLQQQPQAAEYYQAEQQYPPANNYPVQETYPEYQTEQMSDIETINDIAEQIVEERTEKLKKQLASLSRFKEEITFEIEKINQRLQKLEETFNNLQASIIRKIGEYGEDIKSIEKEMHETQDSFSKIINPLTDSVRDLKHATESLDKKLGD